MYKRYVTSTVPVPEPCIVEDPHLPAPSQGTIYSAGTQLEPTQRIAATAPMEEGEELQRYSNSNHHVILNASLIKHFSYGYTNGQIHWPKQFINFQKRAMPILKTVLSCAEACLRRVRLIIQPSHSLKKWGV